MKYDSNNETAAKGTAVYHHSSCHCSLCGSRYRSIAFKGGFVCETCVDYIKGLT